MSTLRNVTANDRSAAHRQLTKTSWQRHKLLTLAIVMHAAAIPVLIAAMIIDPTPIEGVNGWIKPLKFAISITIYSATFIWFSSYVRGWRRTITILSAVTAFSLTVEFVLISLQVIRGTTSHFNLSTSLDALIFGVMGQFVLLISIMNLALAILLVVQRIENRTGAGGRIFAWSLRFGVISSFLFGMGGGYLMIAGPTPTQIALSEQTGEMPYAGAHAVGVTDGGPGLPWVNWSTEGGDLRIGHFFGLHGMQVLPLLGLLLSTGTMSQRYSERSRFALIWMWSAGYLYICGLLIWQALRGQSVVAPDPVTLTAFSVLVVAVVLPTALLLLRRSNPVTVETDQGSGQAQAA